MLVRRCFSIVAGSLLLAGMCIATSFGQDTIPNRTAPPAPRVTKDQISYSLGLDVGMNLSSSGVDLDPALVAKGMMDAFQRAKPSLTDEQISAALQEFQRQAQAQAIERFKALAEKNKKEGAAFLAENAKRREVTALPSGLQVQVLKQGTGPQPTKASRVKVHYTGTFLDGEVFDSSLDRKEGPIEFMPTGVIPGWTEALLRMHVGDKWKLFIPPDLAYGANGDPPTIPPNAVLVFEVELLGVAPAQ